jgi:hypothetical protein
MSLIRWQSKEIAYNVHCFLQRLQEEMLQHIQAVTAKACGLSLSTIKCVCKEAQVSIAAQE